MSRSGRRRSSSPTIASVEWGCITRVVKSRNEPRSSANSETELLCQYTIFSTVLTCRPMLMMMLRERPLPFAAHDSGELRVSKGVVGEIYVSSLRSTALKMQQMAQSAPPLSAFHDPGTAGYMGRRFLIQFQVTPRHAISLVWLFIVSHQAS